MHKATRLPMLNLNQHVLCILCGGYLIDATTIIECLHSFCRSCIVRYLETSKYCPICDVQVHKTRPLLNIRSDKTLQDLVYKLVPGLFKNEMLRRKEFYEKNPQPEDVLALLSKEEKGDMDASLLFTEDEKISICIQHTDGLPPFHNCSSSSNPTPDEGGEHYRYLLCPAGFTVGLLKKFIKLKYDLNNNFRVGIVHSDEVLHDDFTLMDVAYIYGWRRLVPLKLYYIVVDRTLLPQPLPPPPRVETETPITKTKDIDISEINAQEGGGIAAVVEVPKDDENKENTVEISVSEECSEQAMDLSIPQKRTMSRRNSIVSISSSDGSSSITGDTETECKDNMTKEVEEEIRNEIQGYKLKAEPLRNTDKGEAVPSTSGLPPTPSSSSTLKAGTSLQKSGLLKTSDEKLQKTISSILEALSDEKTKTEDDDVDNEEAMDTNDTSVETSSVNEDTPEPMDTSDTKPKAEKESNNDPAQSESELDKSDDLPKLVIVEPHAQKWKVERCESVHSDKENQSVSPTIVDIIPVNSNLPKIEMIEKFEKKEEPETSTKEVPTQCSVVVPQTTQVPQPVYTVQTLGPAPMLSSKPQPKPKPAKLANSPTSNDPKKRGNMENIIDTIVKRKRGRPPKVPKDPTCTPPKIARILPKGPINPNVGFYPNGMNMAQGSWGVPMQFPTGNQTLPNGQMVRVFVQNIQNMAAGQTGGQMMVNGQPQQMSQQPNINNINMQQQQGMNPQFINQQAMMNAQPIMGPQQFQMTPQQQQQQQQMPNNMNMNTVNMGNHIQMMGQSSMANSTGIVQENPGLNTMAVNQGGNTVQVTPSMGNVQSLQGHVGTVPPGSMNQMTFNQQMPAVSVNQQMSSHSMMQQQQAGTGSAGALLTNSSSVTQSTVSTSQPAQSTLHAALQGNIRPNASMQAGKSFNNQRYPHFARMMNATSLFGARQPGYPPAPRMPPQPRNFMSNNNVHKPVKKEKPATVTTVTSSNSSTNTTSMVSSASAVATHSPQPLPSTSTGLNNGYDAPLELTMKKEPPLQKLSAMQPPVASS